MDSNETIVITTVTEQVKVSELSEREKVIWQHGYAAGESDKGMFRIWTAVLSVLLISATIYLFILN